MRLVAIVLLGFLFAFDAGAARVSRIVPKQISLQLERPRSVVADAARVSEQSHPRPAFITPKASATLNCENDGVLNDFNTLLLGPGDLAGTIYEVPANPKPYVVAQVDVGLFDLNSNYPAQIDIIIFESDALGETFDSIAGFTVDLDTALDPAGEVVEVDLREFQVTAENDLLVLYGDAGGAANALLLPAGDDSPRCATEAVDNFCSVLLPGDENTLYIYGITDGTTCFRTTHKIYNFDVVMEVVIESPAVSTSGSSFGALKARY